MLLLYLDTIHETFLLSFTGVLLDKRSAHVMHRCNSDKVFAKKHSALGMKNQFLATAMLFFC